MDYRTMSATSPLKPPVSPNHLSRSRSYSPPRQVSALRVQEPDSEFTPVFECFNTFFNRTGHSLQYPQDSLIQHLKNPKSPYISTFIPYIKETLAPEHQNKALNFIIDICKTYTVRDLTNKQSLSELRSLTANLNSLITTLKLDEKAFSFQPKQAYLGQIHRCWPRTIKHGFGITFQGSDCESGRYHNNAYYGANGQHNTFV